MIEHLTKVKNILMIPKAYLRDKKKHNTKVVRDIVLCLMYANHFVDAFNDTSMFKRRDVDFNYELAENLIRMIHDKNLNKDSLTVQVMK
jgi:hypothetical protein